MLLPRANLCSCNGAMCPCKHAAACSCLHLINASAVQCCVYTSLQPERGNLHPTQQHEDFSDLEMQQAPNRCHVSAAALAADAVVVVFTNKSGCWVLHAAVACVTPPKQLPDAQPWSGCKPALGATCNARCNPGDQGRGYTASCALTDGVGTWFVAGRCSSGNATGTLQVSFILHFNTHSCLWCYAVLKTMSLLAYVMQNAQTASRLALITAACCLMCLLLQQVGPLWCRLSRPCVSRHLYQQAMCSR